MLFFLQTGMLEGDTYLHRFECGVWYVLVGIFLRECSFTRTAWSAHICFLMLIFSLDDTFHNLISITHYQYTINLKDLRTQDCFASRLLTKAWLLKMKHEKQNLLVYLCGLWTSCIWQVREDTCLLQHYLQSCWRCVSSTLQRLGQFVKTSYQAWSLS